MRRKNNRNTESEKKKNMKDDKIASTEAYRNYYPNDKEV